MEHDRFIRNVIKVQMQSTYRSDYFGLDPLKYVKINNDKFVPDWKANVKYSKDSESRFQYQTFAKNDTLATNTTRYGCNKNHQVAAVGGSPNFSPFIYNLSRHYTLAHF